MVSKLIVAVSNVLMLTLSLLYAVGAPPSEFVDGPNVWTQLKPVMLPTLLAAPLLAFLGLAVSPILVRVAALLCVGSACFTAAGVAIAWGLNAELTGIRPLLLPLATLLIPVFGALAGNRLKNPCSVGERRVHETV